MKLIRIAVVGSAIATNKERMMCEGKGKELPSSEDYKGWLNYIAEIKKGCHDCYDAYHLQHTWERIGEYLASQEVVAPTISR